jgi:hypothetical protein
MWDPCHEEFEKAGVFSSGSSYSSFSLATIQEECSLYSDTSFSSFGSISSFDSAIISADSLCSLCSGGRFEILALSKSKSTLTIPPIPRRARPTEIFCDMQENGLFDMNDQDVAYRIPLREDADECNSIDSDTHRPRSPIAHGCGCETTVSLSPNSGKGGRNQELALSAALQLESLKLAGVALASAGTDGTNGPTDAAGAVVDASTVSADVSSARQALVNHDAYTYFGGLNDDLKSSNHNSKPRNALGPECGRQRNSVIESKHEEYPIKNAAEYEQSRNNNTCHVSFAHSTAA